MRKSFMKFGRLSAVALVSAPMLAAFSTTNVFAVNKAGTGSSGTGTAVISDSAQSVVVTSPGGGIPTTGTSLAAIEFLSGGLSLDRVPQFDFGARELQASVTYNFYSAAPVLAADYTNVSGADPKTNNLGYYRMLQVTDKTAGSAGWHVTAWATPFKIDGDSSNYKMRPTDISFNASSVSIDRSKQTYHPAVPGTPGVPAYYATTYEVAGSAADAPNSVQNKIQFTDSATDAVSTNPGHEPLTIWSAASGLTGSSENPAGVSKGKGTWAVDFGKADSATLNLPLDQQTKVGTYKSTITWTLESGV